MDYKIAITTTTFAEYDRAPLSLLKKNGFQVICNTTGHKLEPDEILKLCSGCIGIIAGTEMYSKDILTQLQGLRVISRCGVGIENIDMDWARRRGIKVVNTPDAPTSAVAELTVGIILNLLRKISLMDKELKNGTWKKRMGNLLKGKKIGIIGFGKIGQRVSKMLVPFDCIVAYCDPYLKEQMCGFLSLSLEELLGWADIVSIHACGNKTIIGEKEISLMKKGSWLINTSRGNSIDEEALYNSLKKGYLKGAAVDVFNEEPYHEKLAELDNIILTPHIGSYAAESRAEMEKEAVVNLLRELGLPGTDR